MRIDILKFLAAIEHSDGEKHQAAQTIQSAFRHRLMPTNPPERVPTMGVGSPQLATAAAMREAPRIDLFGEAHDQADTARAMLNALNASDCDTVLIENTPMNETFEQALNQPSIRTVVTMDMFHQMSLERAVYTAVGLYCRQALSDSYPLTSDRLLNAIANQKLGAIAKVAKQRLEKNVASELSPGILALPSYGRFKGQCLSGNALPMNVERFLSYRLALALFSLGYDVGQGSLVDLKPTLMGVAADNEASRTLVRELSDAVGDHQEALEARLQLLVGCLKKDIKVYPIDTARTEPGVGNIDLREQTMVRNIHRVIEHDHPKQIMALLGAAHVKPMGAQLRAGGVVGEIGYHITNDPRVPAEYRVS